MARNVNSGKLTKENILSKVSQVSIFSTYFSLSHSTIEWCIETGEFIKSPIRIDDFPTCGFKYVNGRLKMKDFAGYFWGDCFDAVAMVMTTIYNVEINISNKEDFIKVLRHITLTFKDIFYGEERDISVANDINNSINLIKNKKTIIEFIPRPWDNNDKIHWEKIGISLKDLNIEFVYPVDEYYVNRNVNPKPKYYHTHKDPCYAYMLGKDRNGIHNIKLYHPLRDKGDTKFITNCNHLEGIYNLDDHGYDIIIIHKSRKDTICLKSIIKQSKFLYGEAVKIGHIGLPHETYRLRQNEHDWLYGKLSDDGMLVSLMDNDRAGMMQAIWLEKNFRITPVLIPKWYNVKDISEFREAKGFKYTSQIVFETINIIKDGTREKTRTDNRLRRNKQTGDDMPF